MIKTEEKGSDVNLATYLLADAFRADAETFVVVSNDSDLMEPHEFSSPPVLPRRSSGEDALCRASSVPSAT